MVEKHYCPNCGSTRVEPITNRNILKQAVDLPNIWTCPECSYKGFMPIAEEGRIKGMEFKHIDTTGFNYEITKNYIREDYPDYIKTGEQIVVILGLIVTLYMLLDGFFI